MVDLALLQSISYIAGATGVAMAAIFYVLNLRISQSARRVVSSSSPVVKVDKPISGKAYVSGENVTLQWSGSDKDGDPLIYTLSYSVDGGASWIPLGVSQPKASYVWCTRNLPEGTKYMVKVIASDGVNVGVDSSSAFTIKLKESSTGAGGVPGYGVELILVGAAVSIVIMQLLRSARGDVPLVMTGITLARKDE